MRVLNAILIMLVIIGFMIVSDTILSGHEHGKITAAINDNGCKAEVQIPAKQERRDSYNLDKI